MKQFSKVICFCWPHSKNKKINKIFRRSHSSRREAKRLHGSLYQFVPSSKAQGSSRMAILPGHKTKIRNEQIIPVRMGIVTVSLSLSFISTPMFELLLKQKKNK
jgi:hypothetical protein